MSRFDDLIAEHCPNGVVYRTLDEIAAMVSGLSGKSKADFSGGNARYVSYRNIFTNLQVDQSADDFVQVGASERQNRLHAGDVLVTGSSESTYEVGMSSVVVTEPADPLYLNSFCFAIRFLDSSLLLPEFTKYLFRAQSVRAQIRAAANGVTRINISKPRFMRLRLPVPPQEVQREIVRILDTFTELEAELEAELELRQKQYAHYRGTLLQAADGAEYKPLGELLDYKQPTPYLVSSQAYSDEFSIPVLTAGKTFVLGYTDESSGIYAASAKSPVMIFDDFTTSHKWVDFPFKAKSSAMKMLTLKQGAPALFRFVFYAMSCINYVPSDHARHWISKYSHFKISVPPLKVQQKIVEILDFYDAFVNDLSFGLPAELATRRKQYEYYRDRLLTFEEAPA